MTVLILAEHDGKQIKKATRQAVTAAVAWNAPVHLVVLGHSIDAVTAEAAAIAGVSEVVRVDAPALAHVLAEDVAALLLDLAPKYQVILAPHSAAAKNALPRVAALLDAAMISDVISISAPATYIRPTYAGSVLTTVESSDAVQVLTVRASSFDAAGNGPAANIVDHAAPAAQTLARFVSATHTMSDRPELASASVVVTGGRPLETRFDAILNPLAAKLGAAIGATRAAVDAGYAPNDIQVGQTGTIVAPELYIAAGVSGAAQHLAGMKDSKVIVAINLDPDAAIFQVADFGLVADLFEAVPELTAALA
ncbi:electron transfer flavoprotein subunit alpha/FixB family protein [Iodobacter sp. LRB]|uniref:electron transfer flavoprotein subunit alpha/FixB family protein n=1 Tax=unclassified Iodobacter TaxID=235634 RepID=UPI000C0C61DB|nr:electron transfer flavoprotein subunit alpha/FixB family protein [Iodobacter sp. BJB302]PHV00581.1 electron transfer flavoprotein subunit alpha [Iodobacter sp. BJB302]